MRPSTNAVTTRRSTRRAPASPSLAAPRRPVVLIRRERSAHLNATRWARQLTDALATDLVVVRVASEQVMDARARWQRRFGARGPTPALLAIPSGLGTAALVDAIAPLRPSVVVVGGADEWPGSCAGALAVGVGAPCLVARAPRGRGGLLAATSLEHEQAPVPRAASIWARALGRSLTVLHNQGGSSPRLDASEAVRALADALDAQPLLTRAEDPVRGILEAASRGDADVIVLGAPAGDEAPNGTTPRVSALATRSVMIIPFPAPRRLQ